MKTTAQREAEIGGFSAPGKMPWLAYSTPASECKLGSLLAKIEGTPCSRCYAQSGRYRFSNVQNAQRRRFEAMKKRGWVEKISSLILEKAKRASEARRYFRWFDSGDIQSLAELRRIVRIARIVPIVKFWLPTQERGIVKKFLDGGGVIPDNLTIRISSPKMGTPAKPLPGCVASVVDAQSKTAVVCEAKTRDGQCGPCRACWDPKVELVNYPYHETADAKGQRIKRERLAAEAG
jgi:hypothetical protein